MNAKDIFGMTTLMFAEEDEEHKVIEEDIYGFKALCLAEFRNEEVKEYEEVDVDWNEERKENVKIIRDFAAI